MRWKYHNPQNKTEASAREQILKQIDQWWQVFPKRTADLAAFFSQKNKWDLPGWMEEHLQSIDPHLMWEYGPAQKGEGHRLVITPESRHDLRPLVEVILKHAPPIKNWEFYGHRLAEDLEVAIMTVKGRIGVDISDFQFQAQRNDFHQIDLSFTSPQIRQADDPEATQAAFLAIESLLGEECLNRWIGAIETKPLPREKGLKGLLGKRASHLPQHNALDRLKDTVTALKESMRDQLPDQPCYIWVSDDESINQAEWTLWELKPDEADDYPEQTDLFVGKSINKGLWTTAHNGIHFHSERFSRCGETFLYLKTDGSEDLSEELFADKGEIEDALDEVLRQANLGCHIGGGTGLRYSYIDLAVTDVERAIPLIQQRMQAGKLPRRSWLQFYDTDLSAEWVGIYHDTPPPPMQEE
jgi:hypothetical protein